MGAQAQGARARPRWAGLVPLAFFTGAVATIVVLGAAAVYTGRLLASSSPAFAWGMAGLSLAGGVASFLGPTLRRRFPRPELARRSGAAAALLYGVFYSLTSVATTAGPLALLLATVAATRSPGYGMAIALSYGLGRAPFSRWACSPDASADAWPEWAAVVAAWRWRVVSH